MDDGLKFRVGDVVRFDYGPRKMTGTVQEDRGPIGVNGRRLYLVVFQTEPEAASQSRIELPAKLLELAPRVAPAEAG